MKCLPKALKPLGRSIGRKNQLSIALQSLKFGSVRKKILRILGKDIQKEITGLCSKKSRSIFRRTSAEDLKTFNWDRLVADLEKTAPTFHSFLSSCTEVKRRNRKVKTRSSRPSNVAVLGICASILLRHKNHNLNLIQKIVSLILHRGHAAKQVRIISYSAWCIYCQ